MALTFTIPDPDVQLLVVLLATGFFRIGLSGCGEPADADVQGVSVTSSTLRNL